MPKVRIETYGCTLNQADSDMMERFLGKEGIEAAQTAHLDSRESDFVILNTCTVKNTTEQKTLSRLRKLAKTGTKIIVTGCMASANADLIREAAPLAGIVTTSNIANIGNAVREMELGGVPVYKRYNPIDKAGFYAPQSGAIARIPISEGCLSSCSFCETKFARGPLRSFASENILKAIEMSVGHGAREIELTSQDVGAYGLDRKTDISELLLAAAEIEGDFRIRIGMLNPEHIRGYLDGLIASFRSRKLYRFLHLPVQSGSDRVLASMKRNYTVGEFDAYVRELREKVEGIGIATDIIAGYPTETEEDFGRSLELVRNTRPAVTNMSRFGLRPHAAASRLRQLDSRTIKRRIADLSRTARQVQKEDLSMLVGVKERVLITERNERSLIGRDDSYRTIAINGHSAGVGIGDFIEVETYGNTSVCLFANAIGNVLN
ncbi:MAG: tRNA (N(6)-L-threonylcarbamoyladenosine(37)-C(2))-methylthiotransferase [Candidatus Micrarchaeota archaeon]|nr:tRNA (N(6)-L-threonylcarbamoyladenosine(37)-C(2))-methylthiotransferase [Candidatus Micrarchaeota archaeon]